jgi:MFS family permease
VYAKAYTIAPIKYIYLLAMLIFNVGSIICAAAPNSIALILGRAISGVGASGMMSGAVLILAESAPLEKRAGFLGVISAVFGIASIAGPFIGGSLVDRGTWRWIFGINLPLGAFVMCAVMLFVKASPSKPTSSTAWKKAKEFNIIALTIVLGSLVCLILALQIGGQSVSWDNKSVIALFVVAGVLFIAFLAIEKWLPVPATVPSVVARSRSMWFAMIYAACTSGAMIVAVTYLPIYFQAIRDSSALTSGIMLTPLILGFVVTSILAGIITNIVGYTNPCMIAGTVLSSIGAGFLIKFNINTGSPFWIGIEALLGFGIGFGLQQPMLVVQTLFQEMDIPIAVALISLSQMLGGAIFVAISQTIFQNQLAGIHSRFPSVSQREIFEAGATQLPMLFTLDQLPVVLNIYNRAVIKTFYVPIALSCASLVGALGVEWKSMKPVVKASSTESSPELEKRISSESPRVPNGQSEKERNVS